MQRFKINDLRLTIFLIMFLLFINHQSLFINHTYAADSSPSAEIQAKLEELKTEIASKAANLKQEVASKLKNKAFVGAVKTKSETSLTLAAKSGPKLVNINEDTEFKSNVKNRKYSLKLIDSEDYLATLGDVDETGILTARQVVLLPAGNPAKTYLWGRVAAISDKLVTLKDKDSKTIAVSTNNPAKLKVSSIVIATGKFNENNIFEAEFISALDI